MKPFCTLFPPQPRPAVILGNGPSMRGFDFAGELAGYDSFGLNAAYRYWERIGWHPRYYSCLDTVVGLHHLDNIAGLIENAETNGIEYFLLRGKVVEALGGLGGNARVMNYDALLARDYRWLRGYWYNTGSHTAAWAALLGYRTIILLGAEASYLPLPEAALRENCVLEMEASPEHNPNYFFDDYQQKGDKYHIAIRNHPDFPHEDQLLGWHMIRPQMRASGSVAVNATPVSRITAFPKCAWNNALEAARAARQERDREDAIWAEALPWEFSRSEGAFLDTLGAARRMLPAAPGIFMKVGACRGEDCLPFAREGWRLFAFEADADNRACLEQTLGKFAGTTVRGGAASSVAGRVYPWHIVTGSGGKGSMSPFEPFDRQKGRVDTYTLRRYCREQAIGRVDFLSVSVGGFGLMVLRGFPLEKMLPACIVCSYDDRRSIPLGSDMHDLGGFLLGYGYHVFLSEWHPVADARLPAQWKRIVRYPDSAFGEYTQGHFIALLQKPVPQIFAAALAATMRTGVNVSRAALPAVDLPRYTVQY